MRKQGNPNRGKVNGTLNYLTKRIVDLVALINSKWVQWNQLVIYQTI